MILIRSKEERAEARRYRNECIAHKRRKKRSRTIRAVMPPEYIFSMDTSTYPAPMPYWKIYLYRSPSKHLAQKYTRGSFSAYHPMERHVRITLDLIIFALVGIVFLLPVLAGINGLIEAFG